MRNRRLGRKLGVTAKHRKAMLRNMATDLFRHGKIKTTDAKAKELKRFADKIVTLAKNSAQDGAPGSGLSFKRRIFALITDKDVARKIFGEIAHRYRQRPGGYCRIIKLGRRRGDQTPVSLIELVTEDFKPSAKKKKTRKSLLPAPPPPKEKGGEKLPEAKSAPSAGKKPDEKKSAEKPADENPKSKTGGEKN